MIKFCRLTISTVFRLVTDFSHRVQCNMPACLSEFLTHIGMRTVKVNPQLRNAGQPVFGKLNSWPVGLIRLKYLNEWSQARKLMLNNV